VVQIYYYYFGNVKSKYIIDNHFYFYPIYLLFKYIEISKFQVPISLQEIPLQGITLQEFSLLKVYIQEILCIILDRLIISLPVSWV
jgi:hypothetical protein